MAWIIIFPDGYKAEDWKILALNDAREHTEFQGYGDDIPGLFYNVNDIEYEDDWDHNTNTNEEVDEDFFEEFCGYQQEFWGPGDIENVLNDKVYPWLFSDDGKQFIERHW
jgi:hypothetical protein